MHTHPCTAIVTSMNEERNIAACLETVRWADELLLVDSGSTDATVDIARRYTDRILVNPYEGAARQRNFAARHARHDWLFLIDSDERATPALQAEIPALLDGTMEHACYRIHRRNTFFGRPIRHCGWDNEWLYRLYRKDTCHWREVEVHPDMILADGATVGALRHGFEHHPYPDFDTYFEKFGRYTTWGARDLHAKGRRAGAARLILNPAWSVFKHYILQKGFLDGLPGLLVSGLAGVYVFVKYAKLWAMQNAVGDAGRGGETPADSPSPTPPSAVDTTAPHDS